MSIASVKDLIKLLGEWHLLEPGQFAQLAALQGQFAAPEALAKELVKRGWLTSYQVNEMFLGRGANLLLGSYVLREQLGQGGMGAVFKARNWKLHKTVAVKLIRKERLAHPDAVKRFRREIQAAAQLNHRHIVHAYDADEVKGTTFLVMEFVEDAVDLDALVKNQGPLSVATACSYVHQAALGLQHAHEHGLVHRDIKPHNLLVVHGQRAVGSKARPTTPHDPLPTLKILDMGLARWSSGDGPESSLTLTTESAVMGTPDYIAPEQARASHNVDIRADLYSLGATWYFLLAGRVLFPGGTLTEKLLRHQMDEPRPIARLRPDVPAELAAVIHKLLAKRAEDRFQTPGELAALLERLRREVPLPNEPPRGETLDSFATTTDERFLPPVAPSPPAAPTPARSASKWPAWAWFQHRRRLFAAAAVLLLLGMAGLYGPALYHSGTNHGEPVIENKNDDPEVRVPPPPGPPPDLLTLKAGQRINVLRLPELGRRPIKGEWRIEEGDLVSDDSPQSRLPLPVAPNGSYEFRASFTRLRYGAVQFYLPVAKTSCVLGFAVDGLGNSGISLIDGKGVRENDTKVQLGKLQNNRRYEVIVRVVLKKDQADIKVDLDEKRIVDWSGAQARLSFDLNTRPDVIVLGNRGTVRYHQLEVRVLDGTANLFRSPPPGAVSSPD
jgi:serine/threonine protein kinase